MEAYDTTSDGSVDISFVHHISDPIVSAVEIVSLCGTGYASTTSNDTFTGRTFDGTTVGAPTTVATTGTSWSQARGAFMLSGTLYTGLGRWARVRRTL